MSSEIPSENGKNIEVGFWGGATNKVMLGELPTMTTQQFVGYAALTLTQGIIPDLDPELRPKWSEDAHKLYEAVKDTPTMKITGEFIGHALTDLSVLKDSVPSDKADEHDAVLNSALVPVGEPDYYRQNPFVAQPGGERVNFVHENDVVHVIDREYFFWLAWRIIRGGHAGWQADGAVPGVVDAAKTISDAFETR